MFLGVHIFLKRYEVSLPHDPVNLIVEEMEFLMGQGGGAWPIRFSVTMETCIGLDRMSVRIKLHFSLKFFKFHFFPSFAYSLPF